MAKIREYWELAGAVHIVRDKTEQNQRPDVGGWRCTR